MNAAQFQVAADLWTNLICLSHNPTCRLLVNYAYHRHLLLVLLCPKADTHFYCPTEDRRLSWPRWLATYRDGLPTYRQLTWRYVCLCFVVSHYMRQLLEAVSYCHKHGIIHCSLHPRFVVVSSSGNSSPIKLTGFSVARQLGVTNSVHAAGLLHLLVHIFAVCQMSMLM